MTVFGFRRLVSACAVLVPVFVIAVGCGSEKKLQLAEERIKALESKGVPDTLIAGPKVFLFQVRGAQKIGQTGVVRRNKDSLMISLAKAETWYDEMMLKLKPEVEKAMNSVIDKKKELSGLQLALADSMAAVVDSFRNKNWLLQASQKAAILEGMMTGLINDELTMKKLKPKVTGVWTSESSPEDKRLKAVEKRKFVFGGDGKLQMEEEMKGQTQEYLKEDWKFVSTGKWDMKGDTVLLFIDKEKCERQTYWNLKDNKWIREDKPTYDTTITNKSKDRFMTWDHFEQFMKKVR